MNDFTKDELQMLIHGIHNTITKHTQARYAPLACKLQDMIDNYCDASYAIERMSREEFQKIYPDVSSIDGQIIVEKYGDNLK